MKIKPMRGVAPENDLTLWPFLASPKIDGMRALVRDGVVLSKTLKPIPNRYVQEKFGQLHGCDGELTVGVARKLDEDDDVFGRSRGPIMSQDQEADFRFNVFDRWDMPESPALTRLQQKHEGIDSTPGALWLSHVMVHHQEDLDIVYQRCLQLGFEGLMLRKVHGLYKYGQSTEREAHLLKFKPFEDSECVILGTYEQMKNTNVARVSEDGHTVRSSAKAGKVGKNTLGGFHVKDIWSGVEFDIGNGTGLTKAERARLWAVREQLVGQIFTYTYQKDGTKNRPRIPQFKGWRAATDISELGEQT
jgi:DNA ligase-1